MRCRVLSSPGARSITNYSNYAHISANASANLLQLHEIITHDMTAHDASNCTCTHTHTNSSLHGRTLQVSNKGLQRRTSSLQSGCSTKHLFLLHQKKIHHVRCQHCTNHTKTTCTSRFPLHNFMYFTIPATKEPHAELFKLQTRWLHEWGLHRASTLP